MSWKPWEAPRHCDTAQALGGSFSTGTVSDGLALGIKSGVSTPISLVRDRQAEMP